jgi:hypothetical protein
MSLYQAEKLIDLACSTTHLEEARTAALAACRLIRKHGFTLTSEPHHTPGQRPRRDPTRPTRTEPVREKPPNGGIWGRASRSGRCESCGSGFAAGDDIYVVANTNWCARH